MRMYKLLRKPAVTAALSYNQRNLNVSSQSDQIAALKEEFQTADILNHSELTQTEDTNSSIEALTQVTETVKM